MKKIICVWVGLIVGMICASGVTGAEKTTLALLLPPVVAQVCGQANTVIMWHDIDNDGQADYKAMYVFKDGRLHRMMKRATSQEELGLRIRER